MITMSTSRGVKICIYSPYIYIFKKHPLYLSVGTGEMQLARLDKTQPEMQLT